MFQRSETPIVGGITGSEDSKGPSSSLSAIHGLERSAEADVESSLRVAYLPRTSPLNPMLDLLRTALESRPEIEMIEHQILPHSTGTTRQSLVTLVRNSAQKLDVIHFNWFQRLYLRPGALRTAIAFIKFAAGLILASKAGVTITWTIHNRLPHETPYRTIDWLAHRLVATISSAVFVDNELHCEVAQSDFSAIRHKTRIAPLGPFETQGPPSDSEKRQARLDLGLPADHVVFLAFGLIRPYKRVPMLIRSFRRLNLAGATLLVAGEPWNDDMRTRLVEAADADHRVVLHLEKVGDAAISQFMAASSIVICNYEPDTLNSGVVMLAACHAKGVIVTSRTMAADMPTDARIVLESAGNRALESALQRASMTDTQLMGRAAYEWALSRNWAITADSMVRVWSTEKL